MSQALDIFNLTSGAIGVASSIAQARNVDKVLILDQGSYTPVFEDAYPMKAIVRERARAMEHPIETGSIITDHRIILPIEIEIPLIVSAEFYQPTYQLIKQISFIGVADDPDKDIRLPEHDDRGHAARRNARNVFGGYDRADLQGSCFCAARQQLRASRSDSTRCSRSGPATAG